jgi:hypothetical protein
MANLIATRVPAIRTYGANSLNLLPWTALGGSLTMPVHASEVSSPGENNEYTAFKKEMVR